MFLLDDILFSPIEGFKFVLRTLERVAEEQYTDDGPIRERLLHLQTMLEEGAISEDEYLIEERLIMADLREVRARKLELAGAPPEEQSGTAPPAYQVDSALQPARWEDTETSSEPVIEVFSALPPAPVEAKPTASRAKSRSTSPATRARTRKQKPRSK